MTDDTSPPARPENCQAIARGPFWTCERCGLAWDDRRPPAPACGVMSFGRIKSRLEFEIEDFQGQHDMLARTQGDGIPADPSAPLKRAMELRAILRLVERITASEPILDILNPKRRKHSGR